MPWHARLKLDYHADATGTRLAFRHEGPLRILKSLYPEGPGVCHSVIVHPPGGLVGGDTLSVDLDLAPGAHAVVTTPGATRFYRSLGARASQSVTANLGDGARLEWLPLETLVHSGARADNRLRVRLAPGAEMIGWDCMALGLPAADAPFVDGDVRQQWEIGPRWLERGRTAASDTELLDGPCGWAGRRALGTLWFASGSALPEARRDLLLDAARAVIDTADPAACVAGATAPQPDVVVVRALADRVEPLQALLRATWQAWRPLAWGLPAELPRLWRT